MNKVKLSGMLHFTTEMGSTIGLEIPKKQPIEVPEAFLNAVMAAIKPPSADTSISNQPGT